MKARNVLILGLCICLIYGLMNLLPPRNEQKVFEISIVAVGDNLYHKNVYNKGFDEKNKKFNFEANYENISEFIKGYDISVINQETVFVDEYSKIDTYPRFGTPKECGDAIIKANFNVVLGANNHSWDKGLDGVHTTINYWKNFPNVCFTGMYGTRDENNIVTVIEKNNVKVAILNYTYGTNCKIPESDLWRVANWHDKEKVKKDLLWAEKNADITIVFPHWGKEYVYRETKLQRRMAKFFTEHGADVIIGTHPHVVEPVKRIVTSNGNSAICYYSLGNFLSGQSKKPRILGGIAALKIRKDVINNKTVTKVVESNFIPCVTYSDDEKYRVYLLKDYNDELAEKSRLKADLDYLWNLWMKVNKNSHYKYELR